MAELYIWGGALGFVGALFAYLIWLIRQDAKGYIKLEQAEVLLTKKRDINATLKKIDTKRINTPTADKLRNIKYRD